MKLEMKRDKVISGTDKGNLVGLYIIDDSEDLQYNPKEILLAETTPENADKIIKTYNKLA